MIDTTELGQMVATIMEKLEEEYPDATLGTAMLILELQQDSDDGDDGTDTVVRFGSTDERTHIQIGLIRMAQQMIESRMR